MTNSQDIPNSPVLSDFEDDKDLAEVLDTLMEMHQQEMTSTFDQDQIAIEKAISLNEQMQEKVLDQINFIDTRLNIIEKNMVEAKYSANAENRFGERIYLHKKYKEEVCYFDKSELIEKVEEEHGSGSSSEEEFVTPLRRESERYRPVLEEDDDDDDFEIDTPSKSWSRYERNKLLEGIHVEAKRAMALEFLKNKQDWRIWEIDNVSKETLENFPVARLDWDRISTTYVHSRTGKQCLMQWTTQEHPIINKTPWSKKESDKLSELVEKIGLDGQWERIANELGTNRTISQCFSHYMAYKNTEKAKTLKWTPEEDKKLADAIKIFGNCNWQQIAATLKGRTGQQCLHRWVKSINPGIIRKKWTKEESKLLERAVQLYGIGNWTKVQRLIPGRTDMQCRERWVNVLRPEVTKSRMSEEDIERLVKLVDEVGPKWAYLANFFPGRTDNHLLRYYQHYTRRDEKAAKEKERLAKREELNKKREEEKRSKQEERIKKKEEKIKKIEEEAIERAKKKEERAKAKAANKNKKSKTRKRKGSISSRSSINELTDEYTDEFTEEDDEIYDDDDDNDDIDNDDDVDNDIVRPVNKKIKLSKADRSYKPKIDVSIPTTVRRSTRLRSSN